MKELTTVIAAVCAFAASAANLAGTIDGTNSYSAAAYSGYDSSGNYNVAVGNSSFRASKGDGNVAVGGMALACSTGGVNNVMLGPWAGYGAQGLAGCVGIGSSAFILSGPATNCTSVNGHFVARGDQGRFWISPSRDDSLANGCPPIYYDNGTLYLNARRIVTREDCVRSTAPLASNDWSVISGHVLYVSPQGSDEFPGTSPYYPLRTFAAAWGSIATNDATTIYLLPGHYVLPSSLTGTTPPDHAAAVVGLGGRDAVMIDCGGGNLIGSATASRWQVFQGCTLENAGVPTAGLGLGLRGAYQFCIFYDCKFSGHYAIKNSYWGFYCCGLDGCTVSATADYASGGTASDRQFGTIFNYCDVFDSVMQFTVTNGYPHAAHGTFFHNVFARFTKVAKLTQGTGRTPFGNRGQWSSSTLVVDEIASTSSINEPSTNSIFGLCTTLPNGWSGVAHAVTASAPSVLASIVGDGRPAVSEWRWRCYGYGSEADRAARNRAANQVIEALVDAGAVSSSGGATLMGVVQSNEAELMADGNHVRTVPGVAARTPDPPSDDE